MAIEQTTLYVYLLEFEVGIILKFCLLLYHIFMTYPETILSLVFLLPDVGITNKGFQQNSLKT